MDLATAHYELVQEIRERLAYVGNVPVPELANEFDQLADMFQGLGICHLLEFLDTDVFRKNLVWSGHSRRFFLMRSPQAGPSSTIAQRHLALSRTLSFFDSLAAGALELARDIARLSQPTPWNRDWEYEDDYLYFYFWHRVVLDPPWINSDEARAVLERFEQSLEGLPSGRYEVTAALWRRDRDLFVAAMHVFLDEVKEKLEREHRSIAVQEGEPNYWPRSQVCVEGLALLKLAELLGLRVAEDLPLCPVFARLAFAPEHEVDLFIELERNP
jgi:hypothetical protein